MVRNSRDSPPAVSTASALPFTSTNISRPGSPCRMSGSPLAKVRSSPISVTILAWMGRSPANSGIVFCGSRPSLRYSTSHSVMILVVANSAGSNSTSAAKETASVAAASRPNCWMGTNVEPASVTKPRNRMIDAYRLCLPTLPSVRSRAVSWSGAACISRESRVMRWTVLSTAKPSATAATILVPRFSGAPLTPINPKKTRTGKRFGSMAINPTRADRNMADMTTKMTPAASDRLRIWPVTMSSVVLVSKMRVPVGRTRRSDGKCASAYARIRSASAEISPDPDRLVRTSTFMREKSGLTTDRKLVGLPATSCMTARSWDGSSQNVVGDPADGAPIGSPPGPTGDPPRPDCAPRSSSSQ